MELAANRDQTVILRVAGDVIAGHPEDHLEAGIPRLDRRVAVPAD
jgi:hypothetical protein